MLNLVIDDISRDEKKKRLERLKAMLHMFEEDRGRAAVTMEEFRDWMGAQCLDQLLIRMNCHSPAIGDRPQPTCYAKRSTVRPIGSASAVQDEHIAALLRRVLPKILGQ
jgi:hypothetical protein